MHKSNSLPNIQTENIAHRRLPALRNPSPSPQDIERIMNADGLNNPYAIKALAKINLPLFKAVPLAQTPACTPRTGNTSAITTSYSGSSRGTPSQIAQSPLMKNSFSSDSENSSDNDDDLRFSDLEDDLKLPAITTKAGHK